MTSLLFSIGDMFAEVYSGEWISKRKSCHPNLNTTDALVYWIFTKSLFVFTCMFWFLNVMNIQAFYQSLIEFCIYCFSYFVRTENMHLCIMNLLGHFRASCKTLIDLFIMFWTLITRESIDKGNFRWLSVKVYTL